MKSVEYSRGEFTVSTDRSRLDLQLVHDFLGASYWAKDIPRDVFMKSVENSLCFGVYEGPGQIGFARVITDYATFAYLGDVFIIESHRRRGLANFLMECIVQHPQLQGLRRWTLATRDAHQLYAKFGFKPLGRPDRFMELHNPEVYKKAAIG